LWTILYNYESAFPLLLFEILLSVSIFKVLI